MSTSIFIVKRILTNLILETKLNNTAKSALIIELNKFTLETNIQNEIIENRIKKIEIYLENMKNTQQKYW